MKKNIMLLMAILCCLSKTFATYEPMVVTSGFNADVIANGIGPSENSSVAFDVLNADALVATDWQQNAGDPPPEFSLPASGIINSDLTPGLYFNVAADTINNALLLINAQNSGTISVSGTGYSKLFLLVAGTSGNINFSATIHFSDGSSQTVNNLIAKDWKLSTPGTINGIGAVRLLQNFTFGDADFPHLYEVGLNIDGGNISKTITGISFSAPNVLSYQSMGVFAVTGLTPCTGTPSASNTTSTVTSICGGISFTLGLSNTYLEGGIVYQWQNSTDNVNWTNMASTGSTPTVSITQSSAHYYHCVITCAASGMSIISGSVLVAQNPALDCYCTPIYSNACDGSGDASFINSVVLNGDNGTSLNNTNTGCSPGSYTDYTTTVAPGSLTPLHSYSLALNTNSPYGDPNITVWIDFNDDGFFDPATEIVGTTGNNTGQNLTLNIPLITSGGNRRMRIRTAWFVSVTNACEEYYYGETEDYMIQLLPPPSCVYPIGITSTLQSSNSAQITWTPNSATSYDYVLDQNSANIPVASSTINNTSNAFVNLTGLLSGGEYYFHIRSRCSTTDSSLWFTIPVTIPEPCGATALTIGMPYHGNNTFYPIMPIPTSCGEPVGGNTHARLFRFTSTTGNPVRISTCGTLLTDYFRVYSGNCNNFTCVGGSHEDNNCSTSSQFFNFQPAADSTYYIFWGVFGNFSTDNYVIEITEAVPNDEASGAIALTVGAGCTGQVYTNESASASAFEPITNCSAFDNTQPVWFKFIAPASGSVRISTDGATGTMTDSRIGLFSATDSSNYGTFSLLSCDDDNGVSNNGLMSIIYASDLIPGNTYYVQVDNNLSSMNTQQSPGTFCITVDDLNASMISTGAEDCNTLQELSGSNDGYTGWISLTDNAGKLVALVRNPDGGNVSDYSGSLTIKTGPTRKTTTGLYYLNRNYLISNGNISAPVDLKLFFSTAEFDNLNTALSDSGLVAAMSDLNVLKQSGYDCAADIDLSLGALQTLNQVSNSTTNGVGAIQVSTPGFSNFYISGANFLPLAIHLKSIEAKNKGAVNQINWATASEDAGDHFELERSADGNHFNSIAKIEAHLKPSGYVYFDNTPMEGINFYRLKMMDISGNAHYSKIVQANVQGDNKITMDAYPNPVNKKLVLRVFGTQNGTVILTDISGRTISTSKMSGSEMQIDMSSLSNGFYLVHYADENFNQVIKVNKQ